MHGPWVGVHFVVVHPGKLCTRMQRGGALAGSQRVLPVATVRVGAPLQSGSQNPGESRGRRRPVGVYMTPPAGSPIQPRNQARVIQSETRIFQIFVFRSQAEDLIIFQVHLGLVRTKSMEDFHGRSYELRPASGSPRYSSLEPSTAQCGELAVVREWPPPQERLSGAG